MIEIYISDKKLDLKPADTVALTKQINDIAEIQKRQADYTNQFTIPKTPNNVQIFEYLNITGNQSTKPYKYSDVRLLSNGIPIASRGIAIISETKNRTEYLLHIYAGNYDLFSKIADKLITDIDWSDLLHIFNYTNWKAAQPNSTGYVYPFVDSTNGMLYDKNAKAGLPYANYDTIIQLEYQVPHVFVKTIWDRIFNEAGLEYYGNFFGTYDFLNELIVADNNYFKDYFKYVCGVFNSYIEYKNTGGVYNQTYQHLTTAIPLSVKNDTENMYNAPDSIVIPISGEYTIQLNIEDIKVLYSQNLTIKIMVNGVAIHTDNIGTMQPNPAYHTSVNFEKKLDLAVGDVVTVVIDVETVQQTGYPYKLYQVYITGINLLVKYDSTDFFNETIDFSKCLPKIKQVEFLKSIMQQWGLLYRLDNSGKYHFTIIEELLNGVEGTADLSDKLQNETSETYSIGKYGVKNIFKYNYYDNDKRGVSYADSQILTDIDNVDTEVVVMDSIIEACGDYLTFNEFEKLASIHSFENTESDETKPEIYKLRSSNILKTVMLYRVNQVGNLSIVYKNSTGAYDEVGAFPGQYWPVARFSNLHWNILVENYYSKFALMILKPLKKKVFIWFTPVDIYFLDMFKIIYLKQYQSFFYLNKVNNFIAGKPSDCELIKIN